MPTFSNLLYHNNQTCSISKLYMIVSKLYFYAANRLHCSHRKSNCAKGTCQAKQSHKYPPGYSSVTWLSHHETAFARKTNDCRIKLLSVLQIKNDRTFAFRSFLHIGVPATFAPDASPTIWQLQAKSCGFQLVGILFFRKFVFPCGKRFFTARQDDFCRRIGGNYDFVRRFALLSFPAA